MRYYKRSKADKIDSINRCYFDAEHGWTTLALDRLQDLLIEFPDDPQVEYAEALIRIDHFGQGLRGQECFLRAQSHAVSRVMGNENFHFSMFNSAKHARNLAEYRAQEKIARSLAPNDPDVQFFDQRNERLDQGQSYAEILAATAMHYIQAGKHGDAAAYAELALQAGEWSIENELVLRRNRSLSLRELDKAAGNSRQQRREGLPPEERLALAAALDELERVLTLDPDNAMMWNFKSAWLGLMNRPLDSIAAADKALSLSGEGYVKPLTNKALALMRLMRNDEARLIYEEAIAKATALGAEGRNDLDLANAGLRLLNASAANDDELLKTLAEAFTMSSALISKDETAFWKGSRPGKGIVIGLRGRAFLAGKAWSEDYVRIMAEFLTYFSPHTARIHFLEFAKVNREAYEHCIHAAIYLAARAEGIMRRDACRFMALFLLGAAEPDRIRKCYLEAIIGIAEVGPEPFRQLASHMRKEIAAFNELLVPILCDQSLTTAERKHARQVTLARFVDGVSRDPEGPKPVTLLSRIQALAKWFLYL